jgi:hypothetical protein
LLARLARPSPVWIVVSAGWIAAMLCLTVLGFHYLRTGERTLGQALFVMLVGVGGLAGYFYLRRLFARAAAADRSAGQRDLDAGEVDETRFEIVDAIEVAEEEDEDAISISGSPTGASSSSPASTSTSRSRPSGSRRRASR